MTQRKITINQVAETAGVSVSTVSLVLSGKGRISAATASRVSQVIEELGYVRNRPASMLRGGASGVIGLIVRDVCQPFYAEMTAGLTEALAQREKVLFLIQSGAGNENLQRCFDSLLAQGVEGIVLGGAAENSAELVQKAQEAGLPLICASRASALEGVDAIRPDNAAAARLATEYLFKRGHRRIAWLGGSGTSLIRAERIGGYCSMLLQYGLPFRADWIIECGSHQRDATQLTEQLLHQHPAITAILCHNASVALGCYFGILRSGRAVGPKALDSYYNQQIVLVSFGDVPGAELTDPPLTFIHSAARDIGRLAAQHLLQRLAMPDLETRNLIVPPLLIERESA